MQNQKVLCLLKQLQNICVEVGYVAAIENVDYDTVIQNIDTIQSKEYVELPQIKEQKRLYSELIAAIDENHSVN